MRRSAKRGERADAADGAPAAAGRARTAKAGAAKGAKAAPAGAAKRRTAPAKQTATAAAKAAADVGAAAGAKPKAARRAPEQPRVAPRRKVPPAGYAAPSSRAEDGSASGTAELIHTSLQAAAELAQIGLTVGRQTLQSMLDRLPKP